MPQEIIRCDWAVASPTEIDYHDREWGRPVHDDRALFEKIVLESMQSGLSWSTILHKRENFRVAFDLFDIEKIARYDELKYNQLMENAGIVRNKLKIRSVITNANAYLKMKEAGETLDDFFWRYVDYTPITNQWTALGDVPGKSDLSERISKDLKKKGFAFVGATTIYSLMQSCGLVNDHLTSCFLWEEIRQLSN